MHSVVLSLLGCIPDDLDCLDALVVFAAPVENPHLIEVWYIMQLNWIPVCHHYLHM
jgi:hypothetical protein